METLKQQIEDDVSNVFLNTDGFAETVIRFPEGNGAGVSFKALIEWDEPVVDRQAGLAYKSSGKLRYASSLTFNAKDSIEIAGENYQIETIGKAQEGMNLATFIQVSFERRTRRVDSIL